MRKNKKAKKALLTPKTKTFLEKLNDLISRIRNLDYLLDSIGGKRYITLLIPEIARNIDIIMEVFKTL